MAKFRKSERSCSRKSIGNLFVDGNSLIHYPFRITWLDSVTESPFPVKIAFSVPARRVKKAIDRNRIKRLIRESYRNNKNKLYESPSLLNKTIDMVLIYVSDEIYEFDYINTRLKELITKFIREYEAVKDDL